LNLKETPRKQAANKVVPLNSTPVVKIGIPLSPTIGKKKKFKSQENKDLQIKIHSSTSFKEDGYKRNIIMKRNEVSTNSIYVNQNSDKSKKVFAKKIYDEPKTDKFDKKKCWKNNKGIIKSLTLLSIFVILILTWGNNIFNFDFY